MSGCDDVLRRYFIAIATDRFAASGSYAPLDVGQEVATLREWLCDPALAQRQFNSEGFESLVHRPSFDEIKARLTGDPGFTGADAVVVYVTGHGQSDKGAHYAVLEESDPQRLSSTALSTVELLRWLTDYRDLKHVLLVIDLCHAGDIADEVPAALRQALPGQWIALLTTTAGTVAKLGAFTGAVKKALADFRAGSDRDTTDLEAYLESHVFISAVKRAMRDDQKQNLVVLQDPYRLSCCLPNPKYDPSRHERVETAPARRDLAVLKQDMIAHWGPRARVAAAGDRAGWLFTGRKRLVSRLIEFTAGPPGTMVVSGRAGSGKSAVLARLVTCSDSAFRQEHRELLGRVQPVPPEGAVDIAVLATGKTSEQIAAQIAGALGAAAAPAPEKSPLDTWIEAISRTVAALETPPTVVLDALDEASDPVGVALTLLQRLNSPRSPRLRLLIGVRSTGGDSRASDGASGHDLADIVIEALSAARVPADEDEYWEPGDLAAYVEQILTRDPSPYLHYPDMAAAVAAVIEQRVDRSYLLPLLVAGQLIDREAPLAADDPQLESLLEGGVADILDRDLKTSLPDPADRVRALLLLRASALAFGRGVPWRGVWPEVATAIAPDGRHVGDSDLEWLLRHRISGYLVRDLEDGVTVYRPFHDMLRSSLAHATDRQLGDALGAPQAGHPGAEQAHQLIVHRLQGLVGGDQGPPPPAYVRRHLADHAAAGGILNETVLTPQTLPYLDEARLSRLLRLTQAPPHSSLQLWLSAWRGVRHRWSWEHPESNAAALDVALTAAGGWAPTRRPPTGLAWKPLWAEWSWGGTVVASDARGIPSIAFGSIEERPVLAVGSGMEVKLWDAATGEPLGEPLQATDMVRALAMAEVQGTAVVAAAGGSGTVWLWDATTSHLLRELQIGGGHSRTMALGQMGTQTIVAAGGLAGAVFVWDVDTGAAVCPPVGAGAPVRGVALARDTSDLERLILVVGRGDGTVEQWDLATGTPSGPVIHIGAEVNAVAWGAVDAELVLATADASGVARVWNPRTGQPASDPCRHTDEVRALALARVQGMPLLATASLDATAAIWDPRSGQPIGDPLPHPGPVHDLAFAGVDGRIMLATTCADGNTRLWDPVRPSGARIAVQDNIGSVALVGHNGELLLAAGGRSGKVYLRHGERGDRLAEIALEPRPGPVLKGPQPGVGVALGVVTGRRVLATSHQSVQLWDVDDPTLHERIVLGEYRWPDEHPTRLLALRLKGHTALLATVPAWSAPITLVDLMTSQVVGTLNGGQDARQIAFLSGQELDALAITFNDHIEVYNLAIGELHGPPVPTADWTRHLAMATIDGTDVLAVWGPEGVQFWDVAAGTAYAPPIGISGTRRGMAFGNINGRQVLLTAHYATVRVWNPRTGRRIAELPFGTTIDAMAVEHTADGRLVVAVSGPGIVVTELFDPAVRT